MRCWMRVRKSLTGKFYKATDARRVAPCVVSTWRLVTWQWRLVARGQSWRFVSIKSSNATDKATVEGLLLSGGGDKATNKGKLSPDSCREATK
jgi:hypothetical protein